MYMYGYDIQVIQPIPNFSRYIVSAPTYYHRRKPSLFTVIFTIVTIMGIAVFLLWLKVHPKVVNFHITDASLTEFNYTASNNNTLHYNLALDITIRNPNEKISINYDYFETRVLYQNTRLDAYSFDHFYQDHNTTSVLKHVFKGQHVVALSAEQTEMLNNEKSLGVYGINVKMYLKVHLNLVMSKTMALKPKVSCYLHIPFKSSSGGSYFEATKCDLNL